MSIVLILTLPPSEHSGVRSLARSEATLGHEHAIAATQPGIDLLTEKVNLKLHLLGHGQPQCFLIGFVASVEHGSTSLVRRPQAKQAHNDRHHVHGLVLG